MTREPRIVWTGPARDDLLRIRAYLVGQGAGAWPAVKAGIDRRVRLLVKRPHAGHAREDLDPHARFITAAGYLIVHEVVPGGVRVLRVVHASMDYHAGRAER